MSDYLTELRSKADALRDAGMPGVARVIDGAADRIDALTAERDRLREALAHIERNPMTPDYVKDYARAALADTEPPCPTCGGSGMIPGMVMFGNHGAGYGRIRCPDCTEKEDQR